MAAMPHVECVVFWDKFSEWELVVKEAVEALKRHLGSYKSRGFYLKNSVLRNALGLRRCNDPHSGMLFLTLIEAVCRCAKKEFVRLNARESGCYIDFQTLSSPELLECLRKWHG